MLYNIFTLNCLVWILKVWKLIFQQILKDLMNSYLFKRNIKILIKKTLCF